jgi:hypothetical protein
MKHDGVNSIPRVARYARIAALAALPIGILVGLVLSSGQDAAGAGLGFGIGLALGAVAAIFFGLCYWVVKSVKRTRLVLRFGWLPALVVAIWVAVYFLAPQQYTLSVRNVSGEDLRQIEVHLAGVTVSNSELKDGAFADTAGLEVPPESAMTISWVDSAGIQQSVSVESRAPPHYRHDGGVLMIYIYPQNEVMANFAWYETPWF